MGRRYNQSFVFSSASLSFLPSLGIILLPQHSKKSPYFSESRICFIEKCNSLIDSKLGLVYQRRQDSQAIKLIGKKYLVRHNVVSISLSFFWRNCPAASRRQTIIRAHLLLLLPSLGEWMIWLTRPGRRVRKSAQGPLGSLPTRVLIFLCVLVGLVYYVSTYKQIDGRA